MNDPIRDKVLEIFRSLHNERVDSLRGDRHAAELMETIRMALAEKYPGELANEIAFHLADWNADAAFLVAVNLFPERFTKEEICNGVVNLLVHAPNHLAAAAKLSGFPIQDVFGIGPLIADEE